MISAATRFLAGDWDDAIAEVEASRELADETGETTVSFSATACCR
jgi:hypothetical protein